MLHPFFQHPLVRGLLVHVASGALVEEVFDKVAWRLAIVPSPRRGFIASAVVRVAMARMRAKSCLMNIALNMLRAKMLELQLVKVIACKGF